MVKKYRKKPVVVEAVLMDECPRTCEDVERLNEGNRGIEFTHEGVEIDTLEGTMLARFGDYIIKGVNGELYPCKPDIFNKTYEEL